MQPIQYCVHAPKFLILKSQVLPVSGGEMFLKNLKTWEIYWQFFKFSPILKFSFIIAGIR